MYLIIYLFGMLWAVHVYDTKCAYQQTCSWSWYPEHDKHSWSFQNISVIDALFQLYSLCLI